uniref:Anaphase-promoting complex subunit 10 n=1 Tax=Heterorhabditis bacteriophora TaxID=37862 RepID=A0A1I7XK37_HETBA
MDVDEIAEERSTSTSGCDWASALPKDIPTRDLPMRDISQQAVWTLSSCKTEGNGIHELLHDSVDKYWQSDGPQPHTVTIEFQRKTDISFLMLYLDFKNDESYTPSKFTVIGNRSANQWQAVSRNDCTSASGTQSSEWTRHSHKVLFLH